MALACVLALGCLGRGVRQDRDGLLRQLRAVDQTWAQRADPASFAAAQRGYLDLLGTTEDPRILWRLARAYATQGYVEADPSKLATGKEFGLRCLLTRPRFAGAVQGAGGVITARAIALLEPEDQVCAAWAAVSWLWWMDELGAAGMGLDLAIVQALADRSLELSNVNTRPRALQAVALSRSVAPIPLAPDLVGAEAAFLEAISLRPDDLSLQVDLARFVYGRTGRDAEWLATLVAVRARQINPQARLALENKRAQARAEGLLSREKPAPEPWRSEQARGAEAPTDP